MFRYDDKETINNAKIYEYFAKIFDIAIYDNGVGEQILRVAGLSEVAESYSTMLDRYRYNGQWANPNNRFNPSLVFLSVFPHLDSEHKFLFLKNIIEKVNIRQRDINLEMLENNLAIFGYEIAEKIDLTTKGSTLVRSTVGYLEREEDINQLEHIIKTNYPGSFRFLDEALSNFGNAEYKSCIDNCRSLLESIVKGQGNISFDQSILSITGEKVYDSNGTALSTQKKIFINWAETKKGANRYRLFVTLYSFLSGLGTHGEDVPTKKDALLALREVENTLVWMLLD